jgi:hypothetical protein
MAVTLWIGGFVTCPGEPWAAPMGGLKGHNARIDYFESVARSVVEAEWVVASCESCSSRPSIATSRARGASRLPRLTVQPVSLTNAAGLDEKPAEMLGRRSSERPPRCRKRPTMARASRDGSGLATKGRPLEDLGALP